MWYSFILFPGGWARACGSAEETKPFPRRRQSVPVWPLEMRLRTSSASHGGTRARSRPDTDGWHDTLLNLALLFLSPFFLLFAFDGWGFKLIGLCALFLQIFPRPCWSQTNNNNRIKFIPNSQLLFKLVRELTSWLIDWLLLEEKMRPQLYSKSEKQRATIL